MLCLVLLAALPGHAPFLTVDQGQEGQAQAQVASGLKLTQEAQFASGLSSFDLSAMVFEQLAVTSVALARPAGGLHTRLYDLRL